MDCHQFDGQVVRLEGIKDLADKFVRVRIGRVEGADLNLFEFDLDLTMMVFFLNADEQLYGRFGGRDAKSPDARQSLAGLHYAMAAALDTHTRQGQGNEGLLPKPEAPKYLRDVRGARPFGRCMHCHQVKEAFHAELERSGKWGRDQIYRYPLPDNLGLVLEVDRGNVAAQVESDSPAARAGMQAGDVVFRLNGLPIHSFGDAQFALDRAPKTGTITASWRRGEATLSGELTLFEGWRKTDISWRASMQKFVPSPRLYGAELSAQEKEALGLSAKQLAFRQEKIVHSQAKDAGVRAGDIILGIDGKNMEVGLTDFHWHIQRNYLRGDRVTVHLLRDGERLELPMTFR